MRLILIRHAATEGNRHRYIGREDLPLSAEGERQADLLAARLSSEHLDAIYASPLERAVRTAEPIARGRGLDVRTRDALIEIDYGTLQGTIKGAYIGVSCRHRTLRRRERGCGVLLRGAPLVEELFRREAAMVKRLCAFVFDRSQA